MTRVGPRQGRSAHAARLPFDRWGGWADVDPSGRWSRRRLVVADVVSLLVVVLIVTMVVLPSGGPHGDGDGGAEGVGPAVATATIFADTVTGEDVEGRTAAIGRWVLPARVPDFVQAFDQNYAAVDAAGRHRPAAVRSYKVVQESTELAVVLVWTQPEDAGSDAAGEISGYGVMERGGRWWVFSYEGTLPDVRPGAEELDGFEEVVVPTG